MVEQVQKRGVTETGRQPEMPAGYKPEEVNRRLKFWGFDSEYLDDETGRLKKEEYVEKVLKPNLSPDGEHLGELRIPAELKTVLENKYLRERLKVGEFSAIMGFGHLRPAGAIEMLLLTLGIKCEIVCFGDGKNKGAAGKLENSLQAANVNYIRSSIKEAVEQGIVDEKEGQSAIGRIKVIPDVITNILNVIHKLDKKMYHDIIGGKPSEKVDVKTTTRLLNFLRKIYSSSLHEYVKSKEFSHIINFYPLLNLLFEGTYPHEPHRKLTIMTDGVVNPAGWGPFIFQVAERNEVKDKIGQYWGWKYRERILRSGGFPAPIAGLVKAGELADKRMNNLKGGQPLTIYLAASQVTTTQQGAFKEIIEGCRPLLEQNRVRIIVQTGTGEMGKMMYDALQQSIQANNFSPDAQNNILLHWAPDSQNAIDIFEVVSGSEMPLAVGVKGSEMARMAAMLHIPHIAVGAIGYQEYWNIIIAALQGAPVVLLPKTRIAVLAFIKSSKEFEPEKKRYYTEMVTNASIFTDEEYRPETDVKYLKEQIMAQAYEKTREKILLGRAGMAYVQRDMMLKTLAFLFSGNKEVFNRPTGTNAGLAFIPAFGD